MTGVSGPRDGALANLCMCAEDTFAKALQGPAGASRAAPPPDPRVTAAWHVRGRLTAADALFRSGPLVIGDATVFYGWLLESRATPGEFVVVVRGTEGIMEWLIDAEFAPRRAHPVAGEVESGFFGIYETMAYIDAAGGAPAPAAAAIAAAVGAHGLTITGHSLGAALATYLAFDVARTGAEVRARLIASPRPGDQVFAEKFAQTVPDHMMFANVADVVPRVPFWFGYAPVPNVTKLSSMGTSFRICSGLACQHHALVYECLIDRNTAALRTLPSCDDKFAACIRPRSP